MAEDSSEEKTEAPSDKKRQDARERGTVAKSTEINSVLVLLVAVFMLKITGRWMQNEIMDAIGEFVKQASITEMNIARLSEIVKNALILLAKGAAPVAAMILLTGLIANVIQIGFLFTLKPLTPNFQKINPISGFQRLFSMRSIIELIKNIAKLIIICFVAWMTIEGRFDEMVLLSEAGTLVIWNFILAVGYEIIIKIALVLIIIAILDYAWQRYDHEKQLRMTKQEVKEERKQLDGDPQIKARIRSLQREMARRGMMEEVPRATVVVTNPTYIAIAIRYEPSENSTPVVVAKGKRMIAARIKQLAKDHGIPVIEDKPLARAMFDRVETGFPIPVEFFTAVAEILAYIYRLKNRSAA